MTSMFLVRSEHMTHQGHLFGGDLMAEIDTIGYCLIRERYGDKSLVTRAAEISFERPARLGDVVAFHAEIERVGTTSVTVAVTGLVGGVRICSANLVYVNIDATGAKKPL